MRLGLEMELEAILLEQKLIPGRESLLFFKILTTKAFEDANLDVQNHIQSLEYTYKLLDSYVRPSAKFSLNYLIDFLGISRLMGLNAKKFADDIYFTAGIFPKYLEKRLSGKKFYLDCSRRIYRSLSTEQNDAFGQLSANLVIYTKALNVMREKYLDGNYAKSLMKPNRILH